MHSHNAHIDLTQMETFGAFTGGLTKKALIVGVVSLVISVLLAGGFQVVFGSKPGDAGALSYLSHAYLMNFWFFLSISLGALFFTALQHATRSSWSVVIRRLFEVLAQGTFPLAVLFLPILFSVWSGDSTLYEWNDSARVATDAVLSKKAVYLNSGFFAIRCLIYFVAWTLLSRWFLLQSARQDENGSPVISQNMERMAAFAIPVFALTLTFAAFDWLMSLDAKWFSTMWGVYMFAGSAIAFCATISILTVYLRSTGKFEGVITVEHQHEIGRAMYFALCFWGYIAFSQYLLYWYANIPEETIWYRHRQENGWQYISLIQIWGHFALPFLMIMSRNVKRTPKFLAFWATYMLLMHWIDIFWLVMPEYSYDTVQFSPLLLTTFIGIGGVWIAGIAFIAQNYRILAFNDPRIQESLDFQNL
jgi:hypothetical protein